MHVFSSMMMAEKYSFDTFENPSTWIPSVPSHHGLKHKKLVSSIDQSGRNQASLKLD